MSVANPARQLLTPQERGDEPMQASLLTGNGREDAESSSGAPPEITFVRPIPGFPGLTHFLLLPLDDEDSVLSELCSLEQPEVRFIVAAPAVFFSDYSIDLDQQDADHLGLIDADDALILTVLTLGSDAASTTANLLAPMVINTRTGTAVQVILTSSDWPVRAPLG